MNTTELSSCLQATLIFRGLSPSHLTALSQIAQVHRFCKGDFIFRQGSEATSFFVIKAGRVKVFKESSNGKEQILNIYDQGDNFAEVAVLDNKCFPASATALDPTELITFPRGEFIELLYQYPAIAINMLISLAQHSRHLVEVVEDLSFKDVPQRLAKYLLNLSERSNRAKVVTLDVTKSQLAATLGTISATLSRAFYRLSTDGMITIKGAQIELLDRDRLQAFSQREQMTSKPKLGC